MSVVKRIFAVDGKPFFPLGGQSRNSSGRKIWVLSSHCPETFAADRAAPFMTLGAPVIAVNNMNQVDRALEALREKRATLIAVARALIADPQWPRKVREGRTKDIVECVQCGGMGNVRAHELVVYPEW